MATELLALAAGADSAGKILTATDRRDTEFLDVLIENEQKEVIAHTVVQRYLQVINRYYPIYRLYNTTRVPFRMVLEIFLFSFFVGTVARRPQLVQL